VLDTRLPSGFGEGIWVKPEPARWNGSVYDRVWVITYEDHSAVLADLPQKLLPGDSAK